MKWNYAIKKDDGSYCLVEEFKGGEVDGAYAVIFNSGESRKDIIHTLQLMVCDTFKDKEWEQLEKMIAVRKEVGM